MRITRFFPPRSLAAAGVALLIAGALASCSSSTKDVQVGAAGKLRQAATSTGSTTATVKIEATVKQASGATSTTTTDGVRDGKRSSLTMHLPVGAVDLTMDLVTDEGRQFLRYTGLPAGSPLPDGWIELTGGGGATNGITSSASIDDFLTTFKAGGSSVKDLGTVTRDGASFHRYETTVDLSRSFDGSTIHNRTLKRIMEASAKSLSKLRMTIDTDERGRIARMEYTTKTAAGTVRSVTTLGDFGKPVTIEQPTDAKQMTIDEFSELVYPSAPANTEHVDEGDLMSRDAFVEAMTKTANLSEKLAACVYDELKATSPSTLTEEHMSSDTFAEADGKAMTSAGIVCGMTGGE